MAQPAIPRTLLEGNDGTQWPAQGEWTYEDYLRLPDDGNRYEVIRGTLYAMPPPAPQHQFSSFEVSFRFSSFVRENGLGLILTAPLEVKLPRGLASPVQPDVMYFRTGNEPNWEMSAYEGVPDLIVEILSPRTRRLDRTVKLQAYQDAGVPEYWLIDPWDRTVVVHVLGPNLRYTELCRGGEGDRVRSSILPGFDLEVAGLFPRRK
jgi:Uma2 family endonuclease